MTERLYRFRFRDGTLREGWGHDMAEAFNRLGLPAGAAQLLLDHQDVTPRRARTQVRIQQERKRA